MPIEQCQAQMKNDIDILTSVLGIGEKSATSFLAELGRDPRLFPSHRQITAMAGLDPSIYQSGKYVGLSKISKRGNSHLRRIIWLHILNLSLSARVPQNTVVVAASYSLDTSHTLSWPQHG